MNQIGWLTRFAADPIWKANLWGVLATGTGFAQLFRSHLENVLGVWFLIAGVALLIAAFSRRAFWVASGFALVASAFAARAVSGAFIPGAPWHSDMIIGLVWGCMAVIAASWSLRIATAVEP